MVENLDISKELGELERNICDGENLLQRITRSWNVTWFFVAVGILLILQRDATFIIFGVVVGMVCVWRLFQLEKYRQETEQGLREYRGRKVECQVELLSKRL